jgi:hypothetical protein
MCYEFPNYVIFSNLFSLPVFQIQVPAMMTLSQTTLAWILHTVTEMFTSAQNNL